MNKKIFTTWLILFAAFFISSNFAVSQTTNFWEPTSGPANTEVWSFAVGSSNVVWVGTNSGVFMSTNNGDVWTAKNNGLVSTLIGVGGETGGIPLLIRALAVNSSGHIFAGTAEGLFRSTDVGNNWTKVLPDLNIRSIVISSSGKIYVGIENRTASDPDAGVYLSIDNGNTWTKKNEGLFNLFVKSLAITSDGTILAGTSGSGVFRSTDGGDNWLLPANNADVVVEALTIASDGTIYAATNQSPYKGVIKSTDKGNTWNQANNGLNDLQVNAIVFNSSNSHIFNGTYSQGVFRTTDAGANWYKINNGLPPISNGDNIVRSFTVNSAGVMFAGTKGSGVYRSIIFTTPILYTDKDTLVYTAAWGAALPASQQFLITNVGTGTLNWSAAKSAAWFDISPTSGVNNGLVTVSINSTTVLAPGTYYQNITLTAPGAGASSPHNVVVKYIVTGPGISVISPLNFGNVALGSYKDSTLTITNTGNATLTITSAPNFNINGTDASMFTIQGSITYPINITAGNSRTFTIRFTPASIGAKTAKLSITDNVPITPLTEVVLLGNGVTPQINIDPLNINFGNVNLGLLKDSVVSISSVGNSKLTINNLQLIGTDASSFSFTSPTLPYDITIGSVYSLPVRFSPTTLGNKSALLIISHNATGSPDTVTLSGNGVQPQILITPDTLDFGDVFTGNWKELSFKITNSGSAPLIISSVIKSGIDISQFSRSSIPDSSNLPIIINPGTTSTLFVRFTPNSDGQKSSFWVFNHNTGNGQSILYLKGKGISSSVSINPSPLLDFGNVLLGNKKDSLITVLNTGSAPVTIYSITITGADQSSFTSTAGVITLQPTEKLIVDVHFNPSSLGTKTANINIATSAVLQPYSVTLRGNAYGIPIITVNPTGLDFGNVNISTISTKTVKIKNTGNAPLNVSSIVFTGTDVTSFTLASPDKNFIVNPNESYDLMISFIPTVVGVKNAQVALNHDASGSPSIIPLTGIGVSSSIQVDPNPLNFGDVLINNSSNKSIRITNNGTATLTISGITIAGTDPSLFSIVPAPTVPININAGQYIDVTIKFLPTTIGNKSAQLVITHNASVTPAQVDLMGRGVAPAITINPASILDFGSIAINTSKNGFITITNSGTSPLTISNLQISGTDASLFKRVSNPDSSVYQSITLSPNASFTFTFTFNPITAGSKSAKVTFTHSLGTSDIQLVGVGLAAGILAAPNPMDFGNVIVNASNNLNLTITNTGNAPLTISKFDITGIDAAMFQRISVPDSQSIQISLDPAKSYTITLRFTPTSAGAKTANLRIQNSVSPIDVSLKGVGITSGIDVLPTPLNFGNIRVGKSKIDSVKVTNNGLAPLNISKIDITDKTFFILPDNPGAKVLTPGAYIYIRVQFNPTSVGLKSSILRITHDASGGQTDVPLTGTGIYPAITLTPSPEIDFGDCNIFNSKDATLQIANSGTDTLNISSIAISGANSILFILPNGENILKLAPSSNRTVTLRFTPTTVGAKSALLTILSDAVTSPSSINLKGNGVVSNVKVFVAKTYAAKPGEILTIPVQVSDDLSGKNAKSYSLILRYKKTILYPKEVNLTGTIADGLTISTTNSKAGELHIQITNSTGKLLTGTGNLVNIVFQALLGDSCGTHLFLDSFTFNSDGPTAVTDDGYFELIGRCGGERSYVLADSKSFLMQNSPNPVKAGSESYIKFKIGSAGYTNLSIYDLLGREIMKLVDGNRGEGWYSVTFETKDLPSGVYFYRLRTSDFDSLRKLLIIR